MEFLMLVCRDPAIPFGPQERATIGADVQAWVSEMERRGIRLRGDVLAAPEQSTRVRVRDGEPIVQDGADPHAGLTASGFNLIRCVDLDEAIEVSARHPIARFGEIELRPILEG